MTHGHNNYTTTVNRSFSVFKDRQHDDTYCLVLSKLGVCRDNYNHILEVANSNQCDQLKVLHQSRDAHLQLPAPEAEA